MRTKSGKQIKIVGPRPMYKWARNFKRLQERFFTKPTKLRRILQIEDYIRLNGHRRVYHIDEVMLDMDLPKDWFVDDPMMADLILVTDQKFSRYPLDGIIEKIEELTSHCPAMYLCLNRHYLNIDNQSIDMDLPEEYQWAIATWLKKSLPSHTVIDVSRYYIDYGSNFTWSCPDRHFIITRKNQ